MKRILIVEDEPDIQELLRAYLEDAGYQTAVAGDGVAALALFGGQTFDLVLLDLMLPKIDGFGVCELIRQQSQVPILMLTALDGEESQLRGFGMDIDDYVTKPFSPAELTARIDALYRRIGGEPNASPDELSQGPFVLNTRNRTLEKAGQKIRLTQVEYAIVKLFMQNPGRAMSREDILAAVWGRDYDGELKIVDVNIRPLRIKIEDDTSNPVFITTVWGYGYKWGA